MGAPEAPGVRDPHFSDVVSVPEGRSWASWGGLGTVLGDLGATLGRLGAILWRLEVLLGLLGAVLRHLGSRFLRKSKFSHRPRKTKENQ